MRTSPSDHGAQPATKSPASTTMDLSGNCFGTSYLLIEEIGAGATGRVWRAVDRGSGEQVAVKLLRRELMNEPKAVTRFVQERSILRMLRHHNIVGTRDLLTMGESLGLVMDLVGGGSLRTYLRRHGTLAPAVAAALLAQVADALAQAHRLGIVHRDLKPDNILLDTAGWSETALRTAVDRAPAADRASDLGRKAVPNGSPGDPADGAPPVDSVPHLRLTDFGIARLLDWPGMTTPQALVGTPNYLAPEVITGGAPTPAVDVYALGVLLYELLLGRPPYAGGLPVVVLRRHLECEPRRHAGVPEPAWRTVLACMAKEPGDRPSAEALAATLRGLATELASEPAAAPAEDPYRSADGDSRETPPSGGRWLGRGPRRPAKKPRERQRAAACGLRSRWRNPGRPAPARRSARTGRSGWLSRRRRSLFTLIAGCAAIAAVGTAANGLPTWLSTTIGYGQPVVSVEPGAQPALPSRPGADPARPDDTPGPGARGPGRSGTESASPEPFGPPPSGASKGSVPGGGIGRGAARGPAAKAHAHGTPQRPVTTPPRKTERTYGPLRCTTRYRWDVGHPAVARPCHATGPGIRLHGRLQALPGVRADVSLSLQDLDTGRVVAGPFTCTGLLFTDFARERECGPFHATGVDHGHRYAVVQQWAYTGKDTLPSGTARSDPFRW